MRIEEAKYVGELASKLTKSGKGLVLNMGSGTGHFRKIEQPHIHDEIFAPFENTNVQVIHSDLKDQEGVDISGDIFDPDVQRQVQYLRPSLVLVCNLMEHLQEDMRGRLPAALDSIIDACGVVIITVPYSYPLHFDPIDTYYRPSPEDLCLLFPSYELIDKKVIVSSTFFPELRQLSLRAKLKLAARILVPYYRPRTWLCIVHNFFWLFRPYKVSCVTLKKPEESDDQVRCLGKNLQYKSSRNKIFNIR